MAFWFYRGLRRGIVTTGWPHGPVEQWTTSLPTPPAFVPELLTVELVDRLSEGCTAGAIARDGQVLRLDLGRCTGCGDCLELAGEAAVASGEFLLAAIDRESLLKRISIQGGER